MTDPDVTLGLVCDSPRHPDKVARLPNISLWHVQGGWEIQLTIPAEAVPQTPQAMLGKRAARLAASATADTLPAGGDDPALGVAADEWSYMREQAGLDGSIRSTHTLKCPLGCPPLTVRSGSLTRCAVEAHTRGESQLTLSGIRNTLSGK